MRLQQDQLLEAHHNLHGMLPPHSGPGKRTNQHAVTNTHMPYTLDATHNQLQFVT
jgi:hypothetical protein